MTFFVPREDNFLNDLLGKMDEAIYSTNAPNGLSITVTDYHEGKARVGFVSEAFTGVTNISHINIHSRRAKPGERIGAYVTVEPAELEPEHTLRPEHRQGD